MFGRITTRCRHRPASRGQALVELAIILPLMLLLFAAALDLGRFFYGQITITHAAKEGAFEAARNPDSFDNTQDCDPVTNRVVCRVLNEMRGSSYSVTHSDISLTCSTGTCPADPAIGDTVEVRVQGTFTLATPILEMFTGTRTVTTSSAAVAQLGVQPEPGEVSTPAPTPTPTPTPTPDPTATPGPTAEPTTTPEPTATAAPTPTPTPVVCLEPEVTGTISATPGTGSTATIFAFKAPAVAAQPGCAFTYTWSFGDGGSGSGEAINYQFKKKGSGSSKQHTVSVAISVEGVPQTSVRSIQVVVN